MLFKRKTTKKASLQPIIFKQPRCEECGKFFRTFTDLAEHSAKAYHCDYCNWGTDMARGDALKWKLCEACEFLGARVSSDEKKEQA